MDQNSGYQPGNDNSNQNPYQGPDSGNSGQNPYQEPGQDNKTPPISIAALVCGLVGLFAPSWLGIALGVLGIVFGVMGRNNNPYKTGMATAGMVLGIIDVALWILLVCVCGGIAGALSML